MPYELLKAYVYLCPHCKEWAVYKPRKPPKQKNFKGYLHGPLTHHCGWSIDISKTEHTPPFPWEPIEKFLENESDMLREALDKMMNLVRK